MDPDVTRQRCRLGPAGLAGTLFLLARICAAADFSADIVGPAMPTAAKMYAAHRKVRLETPEASSGYFLIDSGLVGSGRVVFVRPDQRIFMEAGRSSRLARLFVPVDATDPCSQLRAAAGEPVTAQCEEIADAGQLAGRSTTQWRLTSSPRDSTVYWLDFSLGCPVQVLLSDGTLFSLANILVAPQSPALFVIPAAYRKLDPQALIERIKHSDVWAEPPH